MNGRKARSQDLDAQSAQLIRPSKPLDKHLTDPLRRALGHAALAQRGLEIVDQPVNVVRGEALGGRLFDRARELAPIEFLLGPVAFLHLDPRRLTPLERREALLATIADPPAADGRTILRFTGVDDAGVGGTTGPA